MAITINIFINNIGYAVLIKIGWNTFSVSVVASGGDFIVIRKTIIVTVGIRIITNAITI
jgi:hypothetical protein